MIVFQIRRLIVVKLPAIFYSVKSAIPYQEHAAVGEPCSQEEIYAQKMEAKAK
jgi:hypothetical protein